MIATDHGLNGFILKQVNWKHQNIRWRFQLLNRANINAMNLLVIAEEATFSLTQT